MRGRTPELTRAAAGHSVPLCTFRQSAQDPSEDTRRPRRGWGQSTGIGEYPARRARQALKPSPQEGDCRRAVQAAVAGFS